MGIRQYNSEAEIELLRIFLANQDCFREFKECLIGDMFSDCNRIIFNAMLLLDENEYEFDEHSVNYKINEIKGKLNIPQDYFMDMFKDVKPHSMAKTYVDMIDDAYRKYKTFTISKKIQDGLSEGKSISDLSQYVNEMSLLEKKLSGKGRPLYLSEIARSKMKDLESEITNDSPVTNTFKYGPGKMLEMGTILRGNVYGIVARPSHCKTSLGLNIIYYHAFVKKRPCLIFSLEMTKEELLDKFFSLHYDYPSNALLEMPAEMKFEAISKFEKYISINKIPLIIDTEHSDLNSMKSFAKTVNAQIKLDFILIDYVQMIQANGKMAEWGATQQLNYIGREIKDFFAKKLETVVIELAQEGNREGERDQSNDRLPVMADIWNFSEMEKHCAHVWFLKNWKVIGHSKIKVKDSEQKTDCTGTLAAILAKARHGVKPRTTVLIPFTYVNQRVFDGSPLDAFHKDRELDEKEEQEKLRFMHHGKRT